MDGMNATRTLHDLGQSLWRDDITRDLLIDGTLARYIVVEDLDQASPHADVWQRIRREQATLIADAAAARGVVTLIADYVLSVQTK
jgi:hypothetical protein